MLQALEKQGKIQWSNVVIHHLPIELIPPVKRAAELCGFRTEWHLQYHLLTQSDLVPKPACDGKVRLRQLRKEDAAIVNETWLYRSPASLQVINGMIGECFDT